MEIRAQWPKKKTSSSLIFPLIFANKSPNGRCWINAYFDMNFIQNQIYFVENENEIVWPLHRTQAEKGLIAIWY